MWISGIFPLFYYFNDVYKRIILCGQIILFIHNFHTIFFG